MARMDANGVGIVLVAGDDRKLLGTVTDGDVRRAILAHDSLDQTAQRMLERKSQTAYAQPITARIGESPEYYRTLLHNSQVYYLPLLDQDDRAVGLICVDDFLWGQSLPLQAVVMAGGQGSRLRPLTEDLPKPMLPVGGRPLMEIIIGHLREAGIHRVSVTTHYKPEKISEHFKDGNDFGVSLSYVQEEQPLGTVGGLTLLETPQETTLVINGDILTQVNYRSMLTYHREHRADLTVAVRRYEVRVPYGVVESKGSAIERVVEKPTYGFFVNAGIYLLEPSAYRHIPKNQRFDMTDLIHVLVKEGRSVVSFPVREAWHDIGHHEDYQKVQEMATNGSFQNGRESHPAG